MANVKPRKINAFEFKPFSDRQLKLLTWWQDDSPINDRFICVADGAIRSGKSVVCVLSFILYVMTHFNQQQAAIAGKTVMSVRRNIVNPLKQILLTIGYELIEHRSENYLEIIDGETTNFVYLFGGRDESSQDLVQGLTLCAVFLDEVALMPESFYNQITARTSISKAKIWTSSNPSSPYHWFYTKVLKRLRELNGLYIHFTMDDNPSLSEEVKNRYKKMYYGVWAKRYIDGIWCTAEGLIYDSFDDNQNIIAPEDIPYENMEKFMIGVDYGTSNATAFILCGRDRDGKFYACKEYYFAGREEAEEAGNYEARKTDLEYAEDMKRFIGESFNDTGLTYKDIRVVLDPAANSFKLQLRRFHMRTKNADNSVLDGIRVVSSLIFQRRLLISSDCENLIKEIHLYSWDIKKTQEQGKDIPLKTNDHAADSLRYAIMELADKSDIQNAFRNIGHNY